MNSLASRSPDGDRNPFPSSGGRKKVGVALGGGVVRGMAHLGVLAVLEEAGIPVDFVAGTSAGSLVGAMFCSGIKTAGIKVYAERLRWWQIARPIWPTQGFVDFQPLARWLTQVIGPVRFEDLPIPYAAVATDLATGQPVRLRRGPVVPAVLASCAVPGIVVPISLEGRLLADGSLADTVPVAVLREMGADYVIGVDIFTWKVRRLLGPVGMALAAVEILIQRAGGGIDAADILIAPDLAGKTYVRFSQRENFYQLGRMATLERLPQIQTDLSLKVAV